MVATEATVKVAGLNQEILVKDPVLQNRALSGDIVCVELLPQDQWIDNYKSIEPTNSLFEAQGEDAISIEETSQDGDKLVNLIDLVNSEEKL